MQAFKPTSVCSGFAQLDKLCIKCHELTGLPLLLHGQQPVRSAHTHTHGFGPFACLRSMRVSYSKMTKPFALGIMLLQGVDNKQTEGTT